MTKHKQKVSAKTGMLPGSAIYVGDREPLPTTIRVHIYDDQSYHQYNHHDTAKIHQALDNHKYVWIDVAGLSKVETICDCCNTFNIHPLILEDILNTKQRSKLDVLNDGLFIVLKLLQAPGNQLTYGSEQFSMIVRNNLLLTFRESDHYDLSTLYKRLSADNSLIRNHGTKYLAYLIMDNIVDDYFNFVEAAEDTLSAVEDRLIVDPADISLNELYAIKRRTITMRKVIAPLRDIIHLLVSPEQNHFIESRYLIYYRDLHDHAIRLVELIDLHREMSAGMLEIYLSALNNRMNETMKVLTLFASIFIPLTFIAGVYGMNFEFMPELKWRYAYPVIMVIMTAIAAAMFYFFKKKKLI
ncbi:magnesium/cobalt transporter CorA [Legionella spiritensis]|uniref:Magnesium transport protein CorA n=1 Tax=Legionella spiritensis TaxID=452 RepID=A0A0W0YZF0_LEGSP|nr:magnesium/cobalt transporter CorA [Legionella spiritensis]KTD62273.1 cobalt/magnesium uptake transporter [Legionella spiritensis]SNV28579.1 metal ion transporter, MIT family [Legionella spiritensis]